MATEGELLLRCLRWWARVREAEAANLREWNGSESEEWGLMRRGESGRVMVLGFEEVKAM